MSVNDLLRSMYHFT